MPTKTYCSNNEITSIETFGNTYMGYSGYQITGGYFGCRTRTSLSTSLQTQIPNVTQKIGTTEFWANIISVAFFSLRQEYQHFFGFKCSFRYNKPDIFFNKLTMFHFSAIDFSNHSVISTQMFGEQPTSCDVRKKIYHFDGLSQLVDHCYVSKSLPTLSDISRVSKLIRQSTQ